MTHTQQLYKYLGLACLSLTMGACRLPALVNKEAQTTTPATWTGNADSTNTAHTQWRHFFDDPYLAALIDTALANNQELNMARQELEIAHNEVRARKGEYLPFVGLRAGAGADKVARYTNIGAMEATTEIKPGTEMPEPLPDMAIGAYATWEADIWRKLRNARKAAVQRYLSSVEGRNFMVTRLVSEVANSYYELLVLDNQLQIISKNIEIQNNALQIMKLQKEATRVTELAVRRFEAQVLKTQNLQYDIKQKITETENHINYLLGRYPQHVARANRSFEDIVPHTIQAGLPAQLLANRPDIKQAELDLAANRLDVKVARARFYPSLGISAAVGYQAFNPTYLLTTPQSMLYNLAGELAAPLVNRNAIKAAYLTANAKQVQAAYNYEKTLLNGYIEVANQLSRIGNLQQSYDLRARQVDALQRSVNISNDLFQSARADYMEVLLTQRDALEARFDLVETRMQQLHAMVNVYQALGGGWR